MQQTISILGCGWLGFPLARKLCKNGYIITGSTTTESKMDELHKNNIKPYQITMQNLCKIPPDFLQTKTLIIAIPPQEPIIMKQLITALENSLIQNVLFISSTSVYPLNNQIATESSKTKTDSKLCIAEDLLQNSPSFSTTILRFGGLFGIDRNPVNFIQHRKMMQNPEGFVNLIHQEDCINIIEKIIEKEVWNETLNACADEHPQRKLFYETLAQKHRKLKPKFNETMPSKYKIVCNKKVKQLLNYTFLHHDLLVSQS